VPGTIDISKEEQPLALEVYPERDLRAAGAGGGREEIADFAERLLGFPLEAKQRELLESAGRRVILNCTRQWGKTAADIQGVVRGAPGFPSNLAVVSLPYSQVDSLNINCLLMHELGHAVYQANPLLAKAMHDIVVPVLEQATSNSHEVSWVLDRLGAWTEELFCDLFAVRLVGPAYTLACVDQFRLLEDSQLPPSATEFSMDHPADAFRLFHQTQALRKSGWFEAFPPEGTSLGSLLEACNDKLE